MVLKDDPSVSSSRRLKRLLFVSRGFPVAAAVRGKTWALLVRMLLLLLLRLLLLLPLLEDEDEGIKLDLGKDYVCERLKVMVVCGVE